MILDQWDADAFMGFSKPLQKLEKSFNKAGLPVMFRAFVAPRDNKMVEIIYEGRKSNLICIEWESPGQAVNDVAKAVRI